MENIVYKTSVLSNHYSKNRIVWDEFYPSEKKLLESVGIDHNSSVLDIESYHAKSNSGDMLKFAYNGSLSKTIGFCAFTSQQIIKCGYLSLDFKTY